MQPIIPKIISYMPYQITTDNEQATININYPDSGNEIDCYNDNHFGIPIKNKNYPSCYRYNVLIMLAKRLLKEDSLKDKINKNRFGLDKKLINRILDT